MATEEDNEIAGGAGGGERRGQQLHGEHKRVAWEIYQGKQLPAGANQEGTSAAADKAVAGGQHEERPGVRERVSGRQEKLASRSSGVGGNEGGREAYGVAGKSSGVEGKEGGSNSYGVVENHGEDGQGV